MVANVTLSTASQAERRPVQQNLAWRDRFIAMLPRIRKRAQFAFRRLSSESREDAIAEVCASAFVACARLAALDRSSDAYAMPLARFAIAQYRAGRRVGLALNKEDVLSPYCQECTGIARHSLEAEVGGRSWEELAVENRHATPADVAACRIDFRAWLRLLTRPKRVAAKLLASGVGTGEAAARLGVTRGRISQLRKELKAQWESFHRGSKEFVAA